MLVFPNEPEVMDARLAFSDAQSALEGLDHERDYVTYTCGWYDRNVNEERGCFGLVHDAGPLAHLVGDRVKLITFEASVNVYVVNSISVEGEHDIVINRRAFAAVSLLAVDRIAVQVDVMSR